MAKARTHGPAAQRRREALLDAAVDLAAEGGAAAVTHRAVAARAGVSPSTTSYFFSSIHELVQEALRTYMTAAATELQELASRLEREHRTPEEIGTMFASVVATRPSRDVLAQFEAYLHASRTPALRPVVAEVLTALDDAAEAALRAAGCARPEEGARLMHALADGLTLRRLACPTDEDTALLLHGYKTLFLALTMDEDAALAGEERITRRPDALTP